MSDPRVLDAVRKHGPVSRMVILTVLYDDASVMREHAQEVAEILRGLGHVGLIQGREGLWSAR